MIITRDHLDHLYDARVMLCQNTPPPNVTYGWLSVGHQVNIHHSFEIEGPCVLYRGPYTPSIGGNASSGLCAIGMHSYSYSGLHDRMTVGRYCSISTGLIVLDSTHPTNWVTSSIVVFRPHNHLVQGYVDEGALDKYNFSAIGTKPYPVIEHDVWVGRDVTLNMGIRLGTGCIVAASSVVTKSVPPYAIVGGNPAQIIGWRHEPEIIQQLLQSEWWQYSARDLTRLPLDQPKSFLKQLSEKVASGEVVPFAPARVRVHPKGIEPAPSQD